MVAGEALEQAQTVAQKFSQHFVSNAYDAFTNISDTLSHQQKLVTSFSALMKRFEPLVKIADELAKVFSPVVSPLNDRNSSFFQKVHSLTKDDSVV